MKKYQWLIAMLTLTACQTTAPTTSTEPVKDISAEISQLITTLSQEGGSTRYLLPDESNLEAIPQDPKNPLTREKVRLGKLLFHETALSGHSKNGRNGTWSCASCHFSGAGFQDKRVQSIADGGKGNDHLRTILTATTPHENLDSPNLRSPTILNLAYQKNVLWNGMAGGTGDNLNYQSRWDKTQPHGFNYLGYGGAETQAIIALGAHRQTHVDMDFSTVTEQVETLDNYPEYKTMFDQAFPGEMITREKIGLALAAYERTVLPNQSPFQRFLKGDQEAMSVSELKGAQLFFGKANCASCHTGPALNTENYYAIGLNDMQVEFGANADDNTRKGRGGFTGREEDNYKFKVPQLYNLKKVGSLGHGGSFVTEGDITALEKIIRYKLKGIAENTRVPVQQLAPEFTAMKNVAFDEVEIKQLISFLETGLHDPMIKRYEPGRLPSGKRIVNDD